MSRPWRFVLTAAGALLLAAAGAVPAGAHDGGGSLLEFESMTAISGAAVGVANDRQIIGGKLPWAIRSGTGSVDRQGEVEVQVRGLVIPKLGNTNPSPTFGVTLSCMTPDGIVNRTSAQFPATASGDADIETTIALPHPCKSPELFVVGAAGQWFAMSNRQSDD